MTTWLKRFVQGYNSSPDIDECEFDCRIDEGKLDDPKTCKRRKAYLEQLSCLAPPINEQDW
jgi:hypothetical protein